MTGLTMDYNNEICNIFCNKLQENLVCWGELALETKTEFILH